VQQTDKTINMTFSAAENNSILDGNARRHYYCTPLFRYTMLCNPRNNRRTILYCALNIFQYEDVLPFLFCSQKLSSQLYVA